VSATLRGVLWMSCTVLSFCAMAIAARQLLQHLGTFEILFFRTGVSLLIVLAFVLRTGAATLKTRRIGVHLWRNIIHMGGQASWVYAIGALPLMGLAGVLVILRPGFGVFQPASLVMLFGALCFAVQFIGTKKLSQTESPLAVLFWMSVIQTPVCLAAALPGWVAPGAADLPWILAIGVGSFTAHYCMTRAMKLADAMVIVPVDFFRLPLIAVVGALFYAEPFDPAVILGAAMIIAGVWYSLASERGKRAA
jgi:drug/metabolite transporter (DMT)-like permease